MITLPDTNELNEQLFSLFKLYQPSLNFSGIVQRQTEEHIGTFKSEIIACRFQNSEVKKLRCKYMAGIEGTHYKGGHRKGVTYEADIYNNILTKIRLPVPHYYGVFKMQPTNTLCMVIEYLNDAVPVDWAIMDNSMEKAAQWIGEFHRHNENISSNQLINYNSGYYMQWVENVQMLVKELNSSEKYITDSCNYFSQNVHSFASEYQTLIHGEFYPNNILFKNATIFPIDWESAAIGAGEIDLVSLTDRFSKKVTDKIFKNYAIARWGNQNRLKEKDFLHRLQMARLYFCFRWIGKYSSIKEWEKNPKKLEYVKGWFSQLSQIYSALKPA